MSGVYGVVTVGEGALRRRGSRAGDDVARVEISTKHETVRMEYQESTNRFVITSIAKRWGDAQEAPESEWLDVYDFDGEGGAE